MHQHQDSEEDGQGSAFDRVGDKLASGGHDGGHEAVELLVLEGEPQVGGEGVERLEADHSRKFSRFLMCLIFPITRPIGGDVSSIAYRQQMEIGRIAKRRDDFIWPERCSIGDAHASAAGPIQYANAP